MQDRVEELIYRGVHPCYVTCGDEMLCHNECGTASAIRRQKQTNADVACDGHTFRSGGGSGDESTRQRCHDSTGETMPNQSLP